MYVDRLTNGETTFDANIKLPSNVEFKTVDSLFEECEALVKKDRPGFTKNIAKYNKKLGKLYDPKLDDLDVDDLIENMREIYNTEMQYGKPAFAGNVVKLLSVYKGEIMCDVGIELKSKNIIDDLNNDLLHNKVTSFIGVDQLNSAATLQFLHVPKENTNYLLKELRAFCERYTTTTHNNKSKKISVKEFVQSAPAYKDKPWIQDVAYANTVVNLALNTQGLQQLEYKEKDIIWNHKLSWKGGLQDKSSNPIVSQEIATLPKQDISTVPSLRKNEIENSFLNINTNSFPKQAPNLGGESRLSPVALKKEHATAFIKNGASSAVNTQVEGSESRLTSNFNSSTLEKTEQKKQSVSIMQKIGKIFARS